MGGQVGCQAVERFFSGNGRAENNLPRWSIVFPSPIFCEKSQNHYHPLGGFGRFFRGGGCGKATLFQRLLSPPPDPSKTAVIVAQNGMPFCTGCTLFGHILNLQGSSTPFEPLAGSPKNKTAKRPPEVSTFHFRIRRGMYLSHFDLRKQMSIQGILQSM